MEGHTVRTFDGDLMHLRMRVLEMGGLAIDQVRRAVQTLIEDHDEDAHEIIGSDARIDLYYRAIEEEAISLIARRQPVASDLRLILIITKISLDLERIAHSGRKIARLGLELHQGGSDAPLGGFYRDVRRMEGLALDMVHGALDAFDRQDVAAAEAVVRQDREIDREFHLATRNLLTYAMQDVRWLQSTIQTLFVVKALERVGDHACNIAAQVPRLTRPEKPEPAPAQQTPSPVAP